GALNLASGTPVTVYAISRDASNNFVANVSATWSLTNLTGLVAAGDLAPASGPSATFTANLVGSAVIHAVSGSFVDDTGMVSVAAGAAAKIALSGSGADLTSGSTRVLTATIQDAAGNTITSGPDSTLSVSFGQSAGTGSVSGTGSVAAVAG